MTWNLFQVESNATSYVHSSPSFCYSGFVISAQFLCQKLRSLTRNTWYYYWMSVCIYKIHIIITTFFWLPIYFFLASWHGTLERLGTAFVYRLRNHETRIIIMCSSPHQNNKSTLNIDGYIIQQQIICYPISNLLNFSKHAI